MRAAALAALVAAGCAAPVPGPDGSAASAIVGGAETVDFEAVGQVRNGGAFLCSAVLIEPRRAVTAAHCVYGFETDPGQVEVAFVAGASEFAPSAYAPLSAIHLEPDYGALPSRDIAVLDLSADAAARPLAPRPQPLDDEDLGRALTLVGFGRTAPDAGQSEGMRRSVETPLDELTELQLRWRTPGRGICRGDSGGAVLLGGELVGIAIEGDTNCVDEGAGLRLDAFADFLADPEAGDDDDAGSVFGDDDDTAGAEACSGCPGGQTIAWLPLLVLPGLRRGRARSTR